MQLPHCYKITSNEEDESIDLIYELADVADYRRTNYQTGSAIILAIHDLPGMLSRLDDDMVDQLRWLIQVGPEVLIWTIATIDSEHLDETEADIINQFGTRLIGSVDSIETIKYLTDTEDRTPMKIISGSQFGVMFNQEWIRFWIPSEQEVVS